MFNYSSEYLDILKNGLEDWLYVFDFCFFFFYEVYLIFFFFIIFFFLIV
jgi:hypothetical protein